VLDANQRGQTVSIDLVIPAFSDLAFLSTEPEQRFTVVETTLSSAPWEEE
jgi:hypothetical protein